MRNDEEKVLEIVEKQDEATAADVAKYIRHLGSTETLRILEGLCDSGEVEVSGKTKKGTKRFRLSRED